ncbi:MAG: hypothetical protein R3A80_03495 [Bdellovibrionota bacterium]
MKNNKQLRVYLCLCLCTALYLPNAQAMGKKTTNSSSQVSNTMQNFLLNLGLFYARSNPQVAPILSTLGINSSTDLTKFINGDKNGSNFQSIIANAALQYAMSNPQYISVLQNLGVNDVQDIQDLLGSGNGASTDVLLNLAFSYIGNNPKYQVWLDQLGINDVSDLQGLLNGSGGTDLKSVILQLAMIYAQANPQYGIYISLISALLNGGSLGSVVDVNNPFLGAFDGLSLSEIKAIQSAKKLSLN